MSVVIADTGPLVALFNARDDHHRWAIARFRELRPPLRTCESVVAEALHLLRRVPESRSKLFALIARGILRIDFVLQSEHERVDRLMSKYVDVPMDLADACLVRLTELSSGGTRVWTVDRDFTVYRRNGRQRIPLLAPW